MVCMHIQRKSFGKYKIQTPDHILGMTSGDEMRTEGNMYTAEGQYVPLKVLQTNGSLDNLPLL